MSKINVQLARLGAFAPVVLRVVVGTIMAYHGFKKFQGGLDRVEGFFRMVDAPAPALTAPLVAGVELIGGVALIAGLATRLAALALGGVLTGAIILVKVDLGLIAPPGPMPGAELDLALLAGLVAVALLGPGRCALDHMIGAEPASAGERRAAPVG